MTRGLWLVGRWRGVPVWLLWSVWLGLAWFGYRHRQWMPALLTFAGFLGLLVALLALSGFGALALLEAEHGLHVIEEDGGDGVQRIACAVRIAPDLPGRARPARPPADEDLRICRRYRAAPSPLVRDAVRGLAHGPHRPRAGRRIRRDRGRMRRVRSGRTKAARSHQAARQRARR